VQPLQPKQMVPDYGKSQHKNHWHSKTRLPDYHDSAANVTNSAFYPVSIPIVAVTLARPPHASKNDRSKEKGKDQASDT